VEMYNLLVSDLCPPSEIKSEALGRSSPRENFSFIPDNGARMLALCKFVRLIKQMTEVTYKPTLELGTSLLSSERALSCHLVFL
jgi:hypothetical protein